MTFPNGSSTKKAGLILCHDGSNSYYAVVLDRDAGKLALHKITGGSWGAALASESATINDSTAYTIKVFRRQFSVRAWVVGQSATEFTYESSTDFGTGQSGLYSDKTSVTFDDFTAYDGTVRDSLVPRFVGPVDASISPEALRVQSDSRGGQAVVEGFSDDNYMVQVSLGEPTEYSHIWFRYTDANSVCLPRQRGGQAPRSALLRSEPVPALRKVPSSRCGRWSAHVVARSENGRWRTPSPPRPHRHNRLATGL